MPNTVTFKTNIVTLDGVKSVSGAINHACSGFVTSLKFTVSKKGEEEKEYLENHPPIKMHIISDIKEVTDGGVKTLDLESEACPVNVASVLYKNIHRLMNSKRITLITTLGHTNETEKVYQCNLLKIGKESPIVVELQTVDGVFTSSKVPLGDHLNLVVATYLTQNVTPDKPLNDTGQIPELKEFVESLLTGVDEMLAPFQG